MGTAKIFRGYTKDFVRLIRVLLLRLFFSKNRNLINKINRILILAPHPDDEVFGCSGLIQQQISAGKEVYIIFMTRGESSHKGCCNIEQNELISERAKLTDKALKLLNVSKDNIYRLSYPDGSLCYESVETEKLKDLISTIRPDAIFVPHSGEGWNDHIETQNIAKKLINDKNIELYAYCVWFWYYNVWDIDWKNAFIFSMSKKQLKLKNHAIDTYIYAKAPCGKPYSGVLPKVFVWANRWNKELYFKL